MSFENLQTVGIALIAWALTTTPKSARADERVCAVTSSAQDILNCVRENHPEIRKSKLQQGQSRLLEGVARQRPNPELDTQLGLLRLTEDAGLTTEAALLHTIELGGKRSARVERAKSEATQSEAELLRAQEEVVTQTSLALHRLRQIEEELQTLGETVSTFAKQTKILRSRPSLNPEQEVSLSVFTLAQEDGELKRGLLIAEKESLIRNLQIGMGREVPYSKSWLPSEPKAWPELAPSPQAPVSPSLVKQGRANLSLAQAELGLAQSEAWPDLKFGPFFESESAGGVRSHSLGIALSLPLPLFHQNTGAKAYADAGLTRAEESLKILEQQASNERSRELAQYQTLTTQLNKSRWHEEYERRHQKIESLFTRGVLASSLVIEAHRQILEVQKTSHELELKALESFYRISILNGKLPEVSL